MNKKKILAIVAVVLVIAAALTLYFTRYQWDTKDTEELFRQNIASVNFGNKIEDAIPQTDIYDIIKEHFTGELPEGKTEKKAIILGYDGCRADVLTEIQKGNSAIDYITSEGGALKLVYCGGVNYPEKNTQDTSTAPGWCSILTGVWADKHGITANDITKTMEYKTLLTSLTEDKTIDSAAFITKWPGHFDRKNATYLEEMKYCEDNKLNVSFVKCDNDEASHAYNLEEIGKEDCSDFIFVIYEPTDSTGHNKGFTHNNPKYKEAFKKEDAMAFEAINAIKSRDTYAEEDWLIIVTSDHGGIKTNHGNESIQERMTFVAVNQDI